MWDVLMAAVVFSGLALVFRVIVDAITRAKLINKGLVDKNVKYLFYRGYDLQPYTNIKWGLVLVGIGVALLVKQFVPFYMRDESVLGIMFVFAGIAFLVYYWVTKDKIRKDPTDDPLKQ